MGHLLHSYPSLSPSLGDVWAELGSLSHCLRELIYRINGSCFNHLLLSSRAPPTIRALQHALMSSFLHTSWSTSLLTINYVIDSHCVQQTTTRRRQIVRRKKLFFTPRASIECRKQARHKQLIFVGPLLCANQGNRKRLASLLSPTLSGQTKLHCSCSC